MISYTPAVVSVVIVILLAHLASPEEYLWYQNSISQLAGQGYSQAWIIRAGFIGFGILVQIGGVGRIRTYRTRWYREIPIMLYGLAILMSGIFSTTPFIEGEPYSEAEAQWHPVFATSVGMP